MKLKIVLLSCLFALFCITGVFAEDLKIEEGKDLWFGFSNTKYFYKELDKGKLSPNEYSDEYSGTIDDFYSKYYDKNYSTSTVYSNVNIGAGSKVVLDAYWENVFVSSSTKNEYNKREEPITDSEGVQTGTRILIDTTTTTTYFYSERERLGTLSVDNEGSIILNNGSELSIVNEYSLITSTGDSILAYTEAKRKNETYYKLDESQLGLITNKALKYICKDDHGSIDVDGTSTNSVIDSFGINKFTGNIIFERGDTDTILTITGVSDKSVDEDSNAPGYGMPSQTSGWHVSSGTGDLTTYHYYEDSIETVENEGKPTKKDVTIYLENDFIIKSNRSVFNIELEWEDKGDGWLETYAGVYLKNNTISGNGTFVKQGTGVLSVMDTNANGLTGEQTGYGWSIEEGMLVAKKQSNLGNSEIYIDTNGTLGLKSNVYANNITTNGGAISIGGYVALAGDLTGGEDYNLTRFRFLSNSMLVLTGNNSEVSDYIIDFGSEKGGKDNYLISNVDGLATNSITAINSTVDEYKEISFFELILDEDRNIEYSGALQGEMYFRKIGSGTVTLSGENTYTKGTYISEGGLLLATMNSIGEGKIMFDGGIKGDSTTYAKFGVLGVPEEPIDDDDTDDDGNTDTDGDGEDINTNKNTNNADTDKININIENDIHVKAGAIMDVYEDQIFSLSGSIENYDARPGYETEIIKEGLGSVVIVGSEDKNRKINITTFTVNAGDFTLDKGIVLDSYFSLNGENAILTMRENAGITNNIDISSGSLSIFNEANISSSTVNFNNEAVNENMSKLYISSDTYFTKEKFGDTNKIHISTGIEFVVLSGTTTATRDVLDFKGGDNTVIHKSGEGIFALDISTTNFNLSELAVSSGVFRIVNSSETVTSSSTVTVSGATVLEGGIFAVSKGVFYNSTSADKEILIGDGGGIGIYDGTSISSDIAFHFVGTDKDNLPQLLIEADGIDDISIKNSFDFEENASGIILSNNGTLHFSGDKITNKGVAVFGKAGAGEMIIENASGFEMGELRVLEGTMQLGTDVKVDTFTISDGSSVNVSSATKNINVTVNNYFSVSSATLTMTDKSNMKLNSADIIDSTLNLTSATITAKNMNIVGSEINLLDSSLSLNGGASSVISGLSMVSSGKTMNINSTTLYIDTTSCINASLNMSSSSISGYGKVNGNVMLRESSKMTIGKEEGEISKIETAGIVFDDSSVLNIDVMGNVGELTNDVLKVNGDITINNGVTLKVNVIGDYDTDFNDKNSFAFIEYSGNLSYFDSVYNMFSVDLNGSTFISSLSLNGNFIMLNLLKALSFYDMPGLSKNQKEMEDILNKIKDNSSLSVDFIATLDQLDSLYRDYEDNGNAAPFLKALSELSGLNYINSIMSGTLMTKTDMIYKRLDEYSQRKLYNVWAQAYTKSLNVGELEDNPKYESGLYGLIAGFDQQLDEYSVVGLSGFYGSGEFKQGDDKADVTDGGVNIYGSYNLEKIGFRGTVGYTSQNYDSTRKLSFVGSEIKSNYSVNVYSIDAEADYKYELSDNFLLKPFVGLSCNIAQNGDINEKGTQQQRLIVKENTYTKADFRIGVGLQSTNNESKFNWYAAILAKQILTGNQFKMKACFAAVPSEEFEIESTKLNSTAFAGNLGCLYGITEAINVFADLSMDTSSNTSSFNGNIGASYRW